MRSSAKNIDHELTDQVIDPDDEHGGDDDSLGGRAADALGAAARGHSVEATYAGDDEAKDERFEQALKNIRITQRLVSGVEILRAVLPEQGNRHCGSPHRTHGVGDD